MVAVLPHFWLGTAVVGRGEFPGCMEFFAENSGPNDIE
jgi:hypothetical protein